MGFPHSSSVKPQRIDFRRPKIPKRLAYSLQFSSPLACHPHGMAQASSHPAHRIGQITLPGRLCFVTPELSTIPKACASRYRLNPLSLISPDTVSRTLRSAGVGHRFNGLPLPLVGLVDGCPSPDPLLTNLTSFSRCSRNPL